MDQKRLLGSNYAEATKLSFRRKEKDFDYSNLEIQREWDVDSFIRLISSLDIHKGGFDISYMPLFLKRVTQNQWILINDSKIHTLKQVNVRRGIGCARFGYNIHMFFPYMKMSLKAETHLTTDVQRVQVNKIVLLVLWKSCPSSILQYHLSSFDDVRAKAGVKQEITLDRHRQPMELRYYILGQYIFVFWSNVISISNSSNTGWGDQAGQYKSSFIVVSGHNLKLYIKRNSRETVITEYLQHLHEVFETDQFSHFLDYWVDLGIEDVPVSTKPIILLRKTYCLNKWAKIFVYTKKKAD